MILHNTFPKKGKYRAPLKTAAEMAESLGLPLRSFSALLGAHNGPESAMKFSPTSRAGARVYYQSAPVRLWWRELLTKRPDLVAKHGL